LIQRLPSFTIDAVSAAHSGDERSLDRISRATEAMGNLVAGLGSVSHECRRRLRLSADRFFDLCWNVDTLSASWTAVPQPGDPRHQQWISERLFEASSSASLFGDSMPNIPVAWPALRKFLRRSELRSDDTFYDLGCGSGRVVCYAAASLVRRCVGVELSQQFAGRARQNALSVRSRRAPIDIIVADAASLDYSDGTVFFLFNPFGPETLRAVMRRIETSLEVHPRSVRFIYVNPVHRDVLDSASWLTFAAERVAMYSGYRALYWTN
jgi:predicted RNA methylase